MNAWIESEELTEQAVLANGRFLELMMKEQPPRVEDLISIRNQLWDEGIAPSMNLFLNLVCLAVLHEEKARSEISAYSVIAEYLGAEILGGPSKPDLLFSNDVPVEVKIGAFNVTALRQLNRYMASYRAEKGIAVGRELTVDLPPHICFIKIGFDLLRGGYYVDSAQAEKGWLRQLLAEKQAA